MSILTPPLKVPCPPHDWLLVPVTVTDDSFFNDLLRQLDECQSRLRAEWSSREEQCPGWPSCGPASVICHEEQDGDTHECNTPTFAQPSPPPPLHTQTKNGPGHPAEDLLHRSSAVFRATLDVCKPSCILPGNHKSDPEQMQRASVKLHQKPRRQSLFASRISKKRRRTEAHPLFSATSSVSLQASSEPAVNATIAIPQPIDPALAMTDMAAATSHVAQLPPIITPFPPTPLKYSPVESSSNATADKPSSKSSENHIPWPVLHLPSLHIKHATPLLHSKKKQRQTQVRHSIPIASSDSPQSSPEPVVNTTIAIPQPMDPVLAMADMSAAASHVARLPPIITQYPPTPLKYSPVEPSSNETMDSPSGKPSLYRFSWPVLHLPSLHHKNATDRRRSDSDMLNPAGTRGLPHKGTIGQTARRLSQWIVRRQATKKQGDTDPEQVVDTL